MPRYRNGEMIKGYEIVEHIRDGSFASAYRARQDGKDYFLKEYTDPADNDVVTEAKEEFDRFVARQEEIYQRLKGTRLKCVEDLITTFTLRYHYHQVKPFYDCINLADYLATNYDLDDRLFICRNWLGVLREVNIAGIVHQDLNPSQILMVKDAKAGRLGYLVMFADFDWALLDGNALKQVATPGYVTPEHFTGEPKTAAADLYQTGIVFYQLLTEELPFYRAGEFYDADTARKRMEAEKITPPHEIQDCVPEAISNLILEMLRWQPAARPTIDDVIKTWDHRPAATTPPPPTAPVKATASGSHASWIRISHRDGLTMTIDKDTQVTRKLFHRSFRSVLSPSGKIIAGYFPSDDITPLFTIRCSGGQWQIQGSTHRNHVMVNGTPLDTNFTALPDGAALSIYSANEGTVVGEFTIVYG